MKPRLLLNENFPAPATAVLRDAGLDAMAVSECCPGWDDARVIALAVEEQRWLITFDRDYGELVFLRGLEPPPTVILLRSTSYRPAEPADWIIRMIEDAAAHAGKFVVFDGMTFRSRPLRTV